MLRRYKIDYKIKIGGGEGRVRRVKNVSETPSKIYQVIEFTAFFASVCWNIVGFSHSLTERLNLVQ